MKASYEKGDGVASAEIGDTIVTAWVKPATQERWEWWIAQPRALAKRSPDGVVSLLLINASSSPPNAATRKQMQQDFRDLGKGLRRLVVLPLGDSMWASVVRALVRGILLVSGQQNYVVASTYAQAADLVAEAARAGTPSRAELTSAVSELTRISGIEDITLRSS